MNRWLPRRLLPLLIAASVPLSAALSGASGAGTGFSGTDWTPGAPGGSLAHGADAPAGIPISGESLASSLVPVSPSPSRSAGGSASPSALFGAGTTEATVSPARAAERLPSAAPATSLPQRPRPPPASLQDR